MKKRILSLLCALALCLDLMPATAFAAAPSGQELYVGGMQISSTGYWTTDNDGNVTSAGNTQPGDNYIHYDADTNTLTLHNATIQKELPPGLSISGSAIGVINQNGNAELTVQLEGSNAIDGVSVGVYVDSSGGGAALNIKGDGALVVNSITDPIFVSSSNGQAALSIENAKVTATSSYSVGVTVQSVSSETPTLTVDGGSLTATAQSSGVSGIRLQLGAGGTIDGTPTFTVGNNAIVRANGSAGGIISNSSTGVQYKTGGNSTGGIVWNGSNGTVYGNVTLSEELIVNEGETLTIPEGSALDTNSKLINNGTIVDAGGTLIGEPGGIIVTAPAITTESLPEGTEGQPYTVTLEATGNNVTWSASGLPAGLTLDADTGAITGIPTTDGQFPVKVTATNSVDSASREYTLNIKPAFVPVAGLKLSSESLTLQEKDSDTLTATVEPANATNKSVTWESSDTDIATVSVDGTVTAVSAGSATIIATAADGSGARASCEVTVTHGDMVQTPKKDATCTADGTEGYWTCGICGNHYKDESGTVPTTPEENAIPKTGHAWGETAYAWSDDGKTCTATRTCSTDGAHIETADAVVTSEQTKAPSCTDPGETTYTATFDNDWAQTQTKTVADIAPTGHSWGDDGHCTVCGAVESDFVPEIIAGANATWHKGSGKDLSFTSDAAYGDFLKVLVDGGELDASNYAVEPGSTVVALKASYLEALSVGKHTLGIVSNTGTAETEFTVAADGRAADDEAADDGGEESLAKTGDGSMLPITVLSVIAAVAAVAGAFSLRRIRL